MNHPVYCAKGEKCEKLRRENRECVTIEPFISVSGELEVCHVIFPATCITNHMAPENAVETIKNLLFLQRNQVIKTIKHVWSPIKF